MCKDPASTAGISTVMELQSSLLGTTNYTVNFAPPGYSQQPSSESQLLQALLGHYADVLNGSTTTTSSTSSTKASSQTTAGATIASTIASTAIPSPYLPRTLPTTIPTTIPTTHYPTLPSIVNTTMPYATMPFIPTLPPSWSSTPSTTSTLIPTIPSAITAATITPSLMQAGGVHGGATRQSNTTLINAASVAGLKYGHLYPWEDVASVFHLPIHTACEVLGKRVKVRVQREHIRGYPYSLSSFKKVMHELHGLGRWPYRKLQSCHRNLTESLEAYNAAPAHDEAGRAVFLAAIRDSCECVCELYRIPHVGMVPRENTQLCAVVARVAPLLT